MTAWLLALYRESGGLGIFFAAWVLEGKVMAQLGFRWDYQSSNISRWLPGVLAVVGLGILLGAAGSFFITWNFLATARSAPGIVIDLVERKDSDGSITYSPRVRFRETPEGRESEFVPSSSSYPPAYHGGEQVTVLYNPTNPEDAKIQGFFSVWFGTVLLSCLGAVFTGVGFGVARHLRATVRERGSGG